MPKLIDEEEKRYGKLTVCDRSSGRYDKYGHYLWKCICDCGNVCYVKGAQANNKRNNHVIEYNGKQHTLAEWSEITGLNVGTIEARLRMLGWNAEKALTTPCRGHK